MSSIYEQKPQFFTFACRPNQDHSSPQIELAMVETSENTNALVKVLEETLNTSITYQTSQSTMSTKYNRLM